MRRFVRFAACLLSLAFAGFATPAIAQNSPQVVVTSASTDSKLAVLVIFGRNFARVKTLQVSLSGFTAPLTIAASNDTQITTLLPTGISPGSYWATVGEAKGGNEDKIAVTIGAQGPQGVPGPAFTDFSTFNGTPCFTFQGVVLGRIVVNSSPQVIPGTYPVTINCVVTQFVPPPITTPPGTYEPLAATSGTVLAGLTQLTAPQDFPVFSNCSGLPSINCNLPTTFVHAAPVGSPSIAQTGPLSFGFTLEMTLTTVSPVSLTVFGSTCFATLDTSRSGSPTMHVAGTAVFDSDPAVDPPNRITMTNVAFTGIDAADFSFTGDATCVSQATAGASQAATLFEQQFATHLNGARLCGAPGPALFEQCQ